MITDEVLKGLVQTALNVRQWAYAPYSHYQVGAAILTSSGRVYEGVNVENASYPNTICAERAAVFNAVSEGERQFVAIAVVTPNGGSPCGACRQVLAEFGTDTVVIIADGNGKVCQETTVAALLPGAFGPQDLRDFS
jgi:cytidine deaminase